MFVNYTLKPNSGLFSTGVNFRELQTRGRRLKGLFPMTSRRKLHKRWETVSQRVYEGETIETGFASRRRKVWTVASRLILIFSDGCVIEVTTYSKSCWQHCYLEAIFITWTKRESKGSEFLKNSLVNSPKKFAC